ncbi:natural cytotoxicity triggering receptor 3-like isoform X2 [Heterodontus francisci]|uniref:natural cytotoxicity triggering receptor 3-like isoform X2 n=1 Tax=Heterodontus francisci TaxID=7792 RepID=UPI00355B2D3E
MVSSLRLWIVTLVFVNAKNVVVVQSPASINITEGKIAVLYCMYERLRGVGACKWYKNSRGGIELSNSTPEYKGRVIGPNREQIDGKTGASIQLTNVTVRDSGTYYCKVEFITPGEYYGQGTTLVVTVRARNQSQQPRSSMDVQTTLFIIATLFLLTLFSAITTVISYRNKTKDRNVKSLKMFCTKTGSLHDSKEKRDEGPSSGVGNQANEDDNVQYSALNVNEREEKRRSSVDKDKTNEADNVQYCTLTFNEGKQNNRSSDDKK